jgi:hypothetical protein
MPKIPEIMAISGIFLYFACYLPLVHGRMGP